MDNAREKFIEAMEKNNDIIIDNMTGKMRIVPKQPPKDMTEEQIAESVDAVLDLHKKRGIRTDKIFVEAGDGTLREVYDKAGGM